MDKSPFIADHEIFERMNLAERIQHLVLIVTFLLLVLTGLPLFFYEFKLFRWLIPSEAAFQVRGIIHRLAAVGLIGVVVWHIGYTLFTRRGRRNFKELRPRFKDFRDALELFGHNLGLTRFMEGKGLFPKFFKKHPNWLFERPPLFGRYNFIEKFEYWAVAWGSLVMILTGFFIHGYEAILAFLSIIIWHMYSVHFNPEVFPMSKIWLNGRISGHELRTLHPLEYQAIHLERERAQARAKASQVMNPYENAKS
jgi:cytochrome b subunit of formate dehydrogenase